MRSRALICVIAASLAILAAIPASASTPINSPNMSHVANVQFPDDEWGKTASQTNGQHPTLRPRPDAQGGTDIETATIAGRDYAFAGTYRNGLQVVDITDPAAP